MSFVLNYIKNNPQETQRLVGLKSEHLEQLIKQAIMLYIPKSNRKFRQKKWRRKEVVVRSSYRLKSKFC